MAPSTIGSVTAGTLYVAAYDTNVAFSAAGVATSATVVLAQSAYNGTSFTTATVKAGVTASGVDRAVLQPGAGPIVHHLR